MDDWGYEDLVYRGESYEYFRDEYACRLAETYLLRAGGLFPYGDAGSAANDINQLRGRAKCSRMATAGDISLAFYLGRESKRVVHGGKKMVYVITYARLCHGGSTSGSCVLHC